MSNHGRVTLTVLSNRLEKRYLEAANDLDKLSKLEEALLEECNFASSQKKMGQVKVYDRWGLRVSEAVLELKAKDFEAMLILGVF